MGAPRKIAILAAWLALAATLAGGGVGAAGCSCTEKDGSAIGDGGGGGGGGGASADGPGGPAAPVKAGEAEVRVNPLDGTVSVRAVRCDAVDLVERVQAALPKRQNLILDPRARGRIVDVDVRGRPAALIFREIALAAGLEYEEEGGIVSISAPKKAERPPEATVERGADGLFRAPARFQYPVRVLGPADGVEKDRLMSFEIRPEYQLTHSSRTRDLVVREYLEERATYQAMVDLALGGPPEARPRLRDDVGPGQVRTYHDTAGGGFVAQVLFSDDRGKDVVHLVYELDAGFFVERLTLFATPVVRAPEAPAPP